MARFEEPINSQYRADLLISVGKQEIDNNRSRLDWELRGVKTSGSNFSGYETSIKKVAEATINGVNVYDDGWTYDFTGGRTTVVIASGSLWVNHNTDGTKTVTVSAVVSMAGAPGGQATISDTLILPTIPRATQPSVSGAVDAGGVLTISLPRASSAFTHNLTFRFGDLFETIAVGVGSSYAWTVPMSLLNEIPDATSGKGTITCRTYNGSKSVGSETVSFTVRAGSAVVPTIDTLTVTEANPAVASAVGAYVQGQSKLKCTVGGAAGVYGSTIKAYKVTVAGQTLTTANGTTPDPISRSGAVTVTATVTDSRGRTASKTSTVTVLPWAPPKITTLKVQRCNADGSLNDDGRWFRYTINVSVSSLIVGGVQKNKLDRRNGVKLRTGSTFTYSAWASHTAVTLSAWYVVGSGTYSELLSYDARLEIRDVFTTSAAQSIVSVGAVALDIGPGGIGVGKRWEKGALDVAGDLYVDGLLAAGKSLRGSTAAMNALKTAGLAYGGMHFWNTSDNREYRYDGNAWRRVPIIYAGQVTITPSAPDEATSAVVTFPAGLFPSVPDVVPGVSSPNASVGVSSITETGCTLTIIRNSTTNTVVRYDATLS
jgi:hypothetical protein